MLTGTTLEVTPDSGGRIEARRGPAEGHEQLTMWTVLETPDEPVEAPPAPRTLQPS
ncbi:hypothetical protein GCM10023203_29050 [Actinomycetospora straminea]|uniref:Uncharacterized protein n=1 Tax=Actinomycetospora straminea TaxID=663607 RepID=A0ABP9EEE6_9PSEU